jgi:hypothetical protein
MLETGSWIMFAGIVIQLVTAIGFTVIFLIYFRRIHRKYVVGKQGARPVSSRPPAPVGLFFWGGLIVEFLIILRCVHILVARRARCSRPDVAAATARPSWPAASPAPSPAIVRLSGLVTRVAPRKGRNDAHRARCRAHGGRPAPSQHHPSAVHVAGRVLEWQSQRDGFGRRPRLGWYLDGLSGIFAGRL